jgi:hypothetical protein
VHLQEEKCRLKLSAQGIQLSEKKTFVIYNLSAELEDSEFAELLNEFLSFVVDMRTVCLHSIY